MTKLIEINPSQQEMIVTALRIELGKLNAEAHQTKKYLRDQGPFSGGMAHEDMRLLLRVLGLGHLAQLNNITEMEDLIAMIETPKTVDDLPLPKRSHCVPREPRTPYHGREA